MRRILLIALKDLKLAFRDRAALIFMLLAPFALTIGLGLATGSFSRKSDTGILDLPLVVVNDDKAQLGNTLEDILLSEELSGLLEPQVLTDLTLARRMVDENDTIAVVYIPRGFTASIIPSDGATIVSDPVQIELYGNPTSPTGVGIIKGVLEQFLNEVEAGRVGGVVAITQLLQSGVIDPTQITSVAQTIGEEQSANAENRSSIILKRTTASGEEVHFNMLSMLAPGMALMFLMFTVSNGGRTLLVEQTTGTLPRLLTSPTSTTQVLGGKVLGIFLTGLAQMTILIVGTALIFNLEWGSPLAVIVLVLAAVLAATGWGILLASILKTPGQIGAVGSAVMLVFGVLGGSFTNIAAMPDWVQLITRISPNRWGLDGFTSLAMGGGFGSILTPVIALVIMAIVLFALSALLFSRRGIGRQ